ncbi:MAG: DUF4175 domain-containing protein [Paracoccus denitrificans]|nr:MAG: DUF4175 domain-containing protein [Paracoccus denitrificans]PZO85326.1 MAG: DUF4175 domain-containing protein [Paracoccus denitrificans]
MWVERILGRFWPLLSWLAVGLAVLALGLVSLIDVRFALWIGVAWLVVLAGLGLWGWRRFARPTEADALARVDAGLPGAPLGALQDHMALGHGDSGAEGLWAAHRAQMANAAAHARAVGPNAGLSRRDPFGLRLVALTFAAMAFLFGGLGPAGQGLGALASNFRAPPPRVADPAPATGPGWEGWAQPPAYTRSPTIYLNALPEGETLQVPKGTVFSLRLYGTNAAFTQDIGTAKADAAPDAPEFSADQDGTLTVAGLSRTITVRPDDVPTVRLGKPADRRSDGRLVQDVTATDDHGITEGTATVTLDMAAIDRRFGLAVEPEPKEPITLDIRLPRAKVGDVTGRITADLSKHAWANLPVTVVLSVKDGIDQVGTSQPTHMILPGKRFFDPRGAALIELRRDLLWSRVNAERTAQVLRAMIWQPEGAESDFPPELLAELRASVGVLESGEFTPETRDKLAEALWAAAVSLEDGGLDDALEQMKQAQQRLSEAIRNGASPEEIQKLMDDLKAASDAYTDMLAERGEDPAQKFDRSPQQDRQEISADKIQEMLDEIQRLMNEGRMAEAQELLEQFNRMMENLQVRNEPGQGGGRSRQSQRLSDTLREQQELADEALRRAQDPFGEMDQQADGQSPGEGEQPGAEGEDQAGQQSGEGQSPQGQPGEGQSGEGQSGQQRSGQQQSGQQQSGQGQSGQGSLADRQRALREELGRQRGLLPGRGTPEGDAVGQEMDRAGRAMEEAEQALRDEDPSGAMERQAEAIEALRQGMRALSTLEGGQRANQGQQNQPGEDGENPGQDGPPGTDGGDGQPQDNAGQVDPLGRNLSGQGGQITTGDPLAQGGVDPARRARDLLDEIRRRSGQADRSKDERDYLGRLLDRF